MPADVLERGGFNSAICPAVLGKDDTATNFITHVTIILPEDGRHAITWSRDDPPQAYHVRNGVSLDRCFEATIKAWLDDECLGRVYSNFAPGSESASHSEKRQQIISALRAWAREAKRQTTIWTADPPHPPISDPHTWEKKSPELETPEVLKFSCVGFVLWCFEKALGCKIVDLESLPEIDAKTGEHLVNDVYKLSESEQIKAGLNSWPKAIVLPGYIIHAFKRNTDFPYQPALDEAYFPERKCL